MSRTPEYADFIRSISRSHAARVYDIPMFITMLPERQQNEVTCKNLLKATYADFIDLCSRAEEVLAQYEADDLNTDSMRLSVQIMSNKLREKVLDLTIFTFEIGHGHCIDCVDHCWCWVNPTDRPLKQEEIDANRNLYEIVMQTRAFFKSIFGDI
jgi:hypothetical protein